MLLALCTLFNASLRIICPLRDRSRDRALDPELCAEAIPLSVQGVTLEKLAMAAVLFILSVITMGNILICIEARSKVRICDQCGFRGILIPVITMNNNYLNVFVLTLIGVIPGLIYFSILCRVYSCPDCNSRLHSSRSYLYPLRK